MDANELLKFIKEVNDDLDMEWKHVQDRIDQIGQFAKKIAADAHTRHIEKVKLEIRSRAESAIPEFRKEAEATKANYLKQKEEMEKLYGLNWEKAKLSVKLMLEEYFEKK
jgi:hypothetical protein